MTAVRTDITKRLRQNGFRATPQRLAIYDALWNAGSHPTVAKIHSYATKRDPTISLATVYKTLQLFTDIDLVNEMPSIDGSARYDPEQEEHINLVCTNCGLIEDYHLEQMDEMKSAIERATSFKVNMQSIEIYGLCSKCSHKTKT
jgi:Fur family peroxide stress response transcriptional regulator